MTHFETIGGEQRLRRIIEAFVEQLFSDTMIGFMFAGKSRLRIQEMEYQLAAQQLGGDVTYRGRPLDAVHAPLPIMGGHFDRRRQILVNTLEKFEVAIDIQTSWLEHIDGLRTQILGEVSDPHHCNHSLQGSDPSSDETGEQP